MTQRSRNNVAVAPKSEWVWDWSRCPRGAKMLLLTDGGIAVLGKVGEDTAGYQAWAPLPDKEKPSVKTPAHPPESRDAEARSFIAAGPDCFLMERMRVLALLDENQILKDVAVAEQSFYAAMGFLVGALFGALVCWLAL